MIEVEYIKFNSESDYLNTISDKSKFEYIDKDEVWIEGNAREVTATYKRLSDNKLFYCFYNETGSGDRYQHDEYSHVLTSL